MNIQTHLFGWGSPQIETVPYQVDWNNVDLKCEDWNVDVSHLQQSLFKDFDEHKLKEVLALLVEATQKVKHDIGETET